MQNSTLHAVIFHNWRPRLMRSLAKENPCKSRDIIKILLQFLQSSPQILFCSPIPQKFFSTNSCSSSIFLLKFFCFAFDSFSFPILPPKFFYFDFNSSSRTLFPLFNSCFQILLLRLQYVLSPISFALTSILPLKFFCFVYYSSPQTFLFPFSILLSEFFCFDFNKSFPQILLLWLQFFFSNSFASTSIFLVFFFFFFSFNPTLYLLRIQRSNPMYLPKAPVAQSSTKELKASLLSVSSNSY